MGEVLTLTAHGHILRIHDQPGKVRAAWLRGEPYEAELLEHIYEEGFRGVAVDAGANIGNHTLWMAVVCGLEVWAFEPVHHEALRANVALNDLDDDQITVRPEALGVSAGSAQHRGGGRLDPNAGTGVPMMRLDSFPLGDIALIKADVEGMEAHVLNGGEALIRTSLPVIFTEAATDRDRQRIGHVIEPWGYRTTRTFQQPKTRVLRWDP